MVEVGDVELDGGSFLALGLQALGHSRGRGQIQIGQNDLRAEVRQTAADASPMPRPPPVTMATLPCINILSMILRFFL